LEDLPAYVRDKMTFHFVKDLDQVFERALVSRSCSKNTNPLTPQEF
jgi:ATP-dependent Lon protease